MSKYSREIKEKAYELVMIEELPYTEAVQRLRKDGCPTFHIETLSRWRNDPMLDWEGRYKRYCEKIAEKNDAERVKKTKPILYTIQDIRDKVYDQLVKALDKTDMIVTDKNIGYVLSSFVKLGELEFKMTGESPGTPVKQVINVLLMVIEKNPNVGPIFKAHKGEIEDAVFRMIQGE